MSNQAKIGLLLGACVVCVALVVYYAIPGIYHPLTTDDPNGGLHWKHMLLFGALALISLVATRFVARSGSSAKH